MLSLREMIEKFLLVTKSSSATPQPDHDVTLKVHPSNDSLPKTMTEWWNQVVLRYFDLYLDKAHGESEIVLVAKDVYYRNVVLFVQCFQNLVPFWNAPFVKANIATYLWGSALEWYISELSDFNRDTLNNNSGMKS